MKTKVFAGLLGIFMLIMLSGCGGGNNGTPVTSASNYENSTSAASLTGNPMAKVTASSTFATPVTYQDDFNDADFTGDWFSPDINGSYTVVQTGGKLEISGFGVPTPDPDGYHGEGILRGKDQVCSSSPFEVGVDLDLSGDFTGGAISQATILIGDGGGTSFLTGIHSSPTCGNGLFFGTEGTPPAPKCPPFIATGVPLQGRLTIKYSSGNYQVDYGALSFTFSPAPYRTFSGPVSVALFGGTRAGAVHPNFPTVLAPPPTVPPPSVVTKFDNFVLSGSICEDMFLGKCEQLRFIKDQILLIPHADLPIQQSLAAKLEQSCRSIERSVDAMSRGQVNVAVNMLETAQSQLGATINETDAQTNKKIPAPDASDFISFLEDCIEQLELLQQLLANIV